MSNSNFGWVLFWAVHTVGPGYPTRGAPTVAVRLGTFTRRLRTGVCNCPCEGRKYQLQNLRRAPQNPRNVHRSTNPGIMHRTIKAPEAKVEKSALLRVRVSLNPRLNPVNAETLLNVQLCPPRGQIHGILYPFWGVGAVEDHFLAENGIT